MQSKTENRTQQFQNSGQNNVGTIEQTNSKRREIFTQPAKIIDQQLHKISDQIPSGRRQNKPDKTKQKPENRFPHSNKIKLKLA